jgi:hypothetical protein
MYKIIQQELNQFGNITMVDVAPVKIPITVKDKDTGKMVEVWSKVTCQLLLQSPKGHSWKLAYSFRHRTFSVTYPKVTYQIPVNPGNWNANDRFTGKDLVNRVSENKETAMSLRAFAEFLQGRGMPAVMILEAFRPFITEKEVA